jgi:hypothetical protein
MEELLAQNPPSPLEGMDPSMGQDMGAEMGPEMEQDDDYMRRDLILCHISAHEASQLDYWQGGEMIDPETEFRTYPRLRDMLEKPAMKDFLQHLAEEIKMEGHADSNVQEFAKNLPKDMPPSPFSPAPGDFTDAGLKLDAEGEAAIHGDDEMAFLPIKLADMFDEVRGTQIRNPEDGLRQYGNPFKKIFKAVASPFQKVVKETVRGVSNITGVKQTHLNEFLRTGATVGGFMMGAGPVGAALGAGLGNAGGNFLTGADVGKSLSRGIKMGGAGYLASAALPALSSMGSGFGAGAGAGSGAGLGAGAAGAGAGATGAGAAATGAGAAEGSSLLSSIGGLKGLITPALLGGGAYMMMKGKKEDDKAAQKARDDHRAEIAAYRKQYGMDEPLTPLMYHTATPNTDVQSQEDFERGVYHPTYKYTPRYAKGGQVHGEDLLPGEEYLQHSKLIVGKGKGQDDEVPVNVPENTHIWDAASVSALGDGSTKAGARILDMVSYEAKKLAPKIRHKIKMSEARVPTMLSDGEYAMDPLVMHVLGDGNSEIGSKRVDKVRKELRSIKAKTGGKIPPKTPASVLRHLPIPTKHILKQV